ncbi:MAG: fumarate reductase/succinate dehydrogenase flavoprotein subunit, partial [Symploca sp. SIO3C6]|nr:fumarate reductase/succinate dehydrogenase flavoprotein subunit [Symploca sp. SIO3C6]
AKYCCVIVNKKDIEAEHRASDRLHTLLSIQGNKTVKTFHRQLGQILWDRVGISRDRSGLKEAIGHIQSLREEFWHNLRVPGELNTLNKNLELAGRVADFLELGELMARDALERDESCGCHFREEHQTSDGEAQRNDEDFSRVFAWEYSGGDRPPILHAESLTFEAVQLTQRSYK